MNKMVVMVAGIKLFLLLTLLFISVWMLMDHVARNYECPSCGDCVPEVYLVSEAKIQDGFVYSSIDNVRLVKVAPDGTFYYDSGTQSIILRKPNTFLKGVQIGSN